MSKNGWRKKWQQYQNKWKKPKTYRWKKPKKSVFNYLSREPICPKGTIEIHTDAGFATSQYSKEVGESVKGILCWTHERLKYPKFSEIVIEKVRSHQQYNSVFEFMAIAEALEYALEEGIQHVLIVTDSTNCRCWFNKMKPKKKTIYHLQTFQKIQELKNHFSFVRIVWRSRENNLAGKWIEKNYNL